MRAAPAARPGPDPLAQARHQIEDRVNDPPRQIAAQRADEHVANLFLADAGDAKRAGDGQHHDQPEQDLRDPLHGIKEKLGRNDRVFPLALMRECVV